MKDNVGICRHYQTGSCARDACKFAYAYEICLGPHGRNQCDNISGGRGKGKNKNKGKGKGKGKNKTH